MVESRIAELMSVFDQGDLRWRVEAEARLATLGPAAVEPLIGQLERASVPGRFHAVRALAALARQGSAERVVEALVRHLGDEESHAAVAIAAEQMLVQLGPASAAVLLRAARDGALPPTARARALRAISKIGLGQLSEIAPLLRDPAPGVRRQAAAASAAVGGPEAALALRDLLKDPDRFVREGAAEALLTLGSGAGRLIFEEALADPEERGWAEEMLERLDALQHRGELLE